MKTATALLPTLALAFSTSQAALTTHNATYDLFTVSIFETYGSLAEVVLTKNDAWLTETYDNLLSDVEAQLALGQEAFPYYNGRLNEFYDNAIDYDESFDSLLAEVEAFDLPVSSLFGYAARPYFDAAFDMVETFLPTLKNTTLSEWHMKERQAMEKRVLSGASTGLLAGKWSEYLLTLVDNEAASKSFDDAASDFYSRMQDEYDLPADDDDDSE